MDTLKGKAEIVDEVSMVLSRHNK